MTVGLREMGFFVQPLFWSKLRFPVSWQGSSDHICAHPTTCSSHPIKMVHSYFCATLLFLFTLTSCSLNSAFTTQQYSDAHSKSIMFFEGQRSGKLPANQRLKWRGDSALRDGSSVNVDLVGGYYDVGDNVKFGLPMAFTTTILASSIIEFGENMRSELENAKEALCWGSDYLVKAATTTPGTLYVQVGEPYSDHYCWERPEDMDTPRNVYKVSAQNPGSDVAAETTAALAVASIVFHDSDPSYSHKLQTAKNVFDLADKYRGSYSDSLSSVVCPFYCSYSGYNDELLWGAAWIHRASQDTSYLSYIQSNGHLMIRIHLQDDSLEQPPPSLFPKGLVVKIYRIKLYRFQLWRQVGNVISQNEADSGPLGAANEEADCSHDFQQLQGNSTAWVARMKK